MAFARPLLAAAAVVAVLPMFCLSGCGDGIKAHEPSGKKSDQPATGKQAAGNTSGAKIPATSGRSTTQPARIEAFDSTPLYPKISGYVKSLHGVDIGDRITNLKKPLATLHVPEMHDEERQKIALETQANAEVDQASAAVTLAGARLSATQAQIEEANAGLARSQGACSRWTAQLKRYRGLAGDGIVTQKLVEETQFQYESSAAACKESEAKIRSAKAAHSAAAAAVEKARADHRAAQARVKVAAANRAYAQTMLKYAVIHAPYPGVITERHADPGQFVRPGDSEKSRPLFVIARTDTVRVFVDVPEREAPFIARGNKAVIRVQSLGKQGGFSARVTRTSFSLNPRNRTLRVEIDVKNPTGLLRPGMYATATIHLSPRPVSD